MKKTKQKNTTIAQNRRARFEYLIEETIEAGIILEGWEVKSIRAGKVQISDSHVIIKRGEAFLVGAVINPLPTASTHISPDQTRTRKLLLTKKELNQLIGKIERKGYTVVPLSLYWKKNKVKVKIATAKGKKSHDKRATIKEREWKRQQARIMKKR